MPTYMIIEHIAEGRLDEVYARLEAQGRMLPEGLEYIDSWLAKNTSLCFQLMQTNDYSLFEEWIAQWQDLVEFEIIEIGAKPSAD